jgi:hypothetical protein
MSETVWKLVPVEPTPEMRRAFHKAQEFVEEGGYVYSPDYQWKAMLDAAPHPPTLASTAKARAALEPKP